MKFLGLLFIFFFSTSVYFSVSNNAPKGDKVKISDAEHSEPIEKSRSYTVDTAISTIGLFLKL